MRSFSDGDGAGATAEGGGPLWAEIARTLGVEIAEGRYRPGAKLPTEAALATRFGVNRHTVRRALASLSAQGIVRSRQGAGVFVTERPPTYALGRRVRFHENLEAAGQRGEKRTLRLESLAADVEAAEALAMDPGAPVHVWEGLALADGVPISVFRSVFPAERLPGLARMLEATTSVTKALAAEGVTDFTRRSTRLTAVRADGPTARHLSLPDGAPLLRTVGVNVGPDGRPVEFGTAWFAGDRVTLTLD